MKSTCLFKRIVIVRAHSIGFKSRNGLESKCRSQGGIKIRFSLSLNVTEIPSFFLQENVVEKQVRKRESERVGLESFKS